jgi:hypothetical protein
MTLPGDGPCLPFLCSNQASPLNPRGEDRHWDVYTILMSGNELACRANEQSQNTGMCHTFRLCKKM